MISRVLRDLNGVDNGFIESAVTFFLSFLDSKHHFCLTVVLEVNDLENL